MTMRFMEDLAKRVERLEKRAYQQVRRGEIVSVETDGTYGVGFQDGYNGFTYLANVIYSPYVTELEYTDTTITSTTVRTVIFPVPQIGEEVLVWLLDDKGHTAFIIGKPIA